MDAPNATTSAPVTAVADDGPETARGREATMQAIVQDAYGSADVLELADIDKPGRKAKPEWMRRMIGRKRKTLVVCLRCHQDIHGGRFDGAPISTLESRMR